MTFCLYLSSLVVNAFGGIGSGVLLNKSATTSPMLTQPLQSALQQFFWYSQIIRCEKWQKLLSPKTFTTTLLSSETESTTNNSVPFEIELQFEAR